MVRVLAVADEPSERLWSSRVRELRPDLVLAAGDLPWDYLEFIASMGDAPLVFVPGNHDPALPRSVAHACGLHLRGGFPVPDPRPHGGVDADGRVVDVAGLRIAGLGGCVRYRTGPHQYTQTEFRRRAGRLARLVERHRPARPERLDILLTHAPPRHCGDDDDPPHHGIEALRGLIDRLAPRLHVHGHIHPYGRPRPDRTLGSTTVRNVIPYAIFDLPLPATVDTVRPR